MSVSAGTGGTTLVGVVVGGAVTQSDAGAPTSVVRSLPFTGASDVMVLVAIALVLLVAGILAVGLVRRRPVDGDLP